MAAFAIRHFDMLDYVDQSKALGADEKLAKYQARQIEQAIDIAVSTAKAEIDGRELATKRDLKEGLKELEVVLGKNIKDVELRIERVKSELILWVGGLMAGFLVASGLIQHFLK